MARALRSSGASASASTSTSPATTNGVAARNRLLKRKRTNDDDQPQNSPKPAPVHDEIGEDDDSASPLTDLAPSPAVKHEVLEDVKEDTQTSRVKEDTRSPTPGVFLDGCDVPPSAIDAHKLLTVLEMFDTQSLLARHIPPADISLRAMLKTPVHSLRTLRVAIAALAPIHSHSRTAPSLELTAQRSFCELALGLIDEIAEKQTVSEDRTSIYQVSAEHKSKYRSDDTKPTRYALQQTIHSTDFYTSIGDDMLTPEKAASLATGQASLTAIIPSLTIPVSAMPTLGAYSRKPLAYQPVPQPPLHSVPSILELSYGPRSSFAPTYDSAGSAVTRATVDSYVARRARASRAMGPPFVLGTNIAGDSEMTDGEIKPTKPSSPSIHPDLVPISLIDPSLASQSQSSVIVAPEPEPSQDPELAHALDTAFEELALEESVKGVLQSNARAMTRLVDIQNERLQRWNGRSPDLTVLDAEEGEERDLANCIEKTLVLLASLRPRTILSSLSSPAAIAAPTSLIPPTSALRTLHCTLPTEPTPGYRGTLDPRREMALKDNTTIKTGNVPVPASVPTAGTPVSGARAAVPTGAGGRPTYGGQPVAVGAYPQAHAGATQYPQVAAAQYPQVSAAQYSQVPAQYPAYQAQQYPTGTQPGQYPYPYPYGAAAAQAGGYPAPGQVAGYVTPGQAAAYPAPVPAGTSTPRVITNVIKPVVQGAWSPGQGHTPGGTGYTLAAVTSGVGAGTGTYTPTAATTTYTPTTNAAPYNPAVSTYNPSVNVTGYHPGVAGYTPAVAQAYSPVTAAAYAPTPVKPGVRGPIPSHVRSTPGTPGTPGSPSTYLPNSTGGYAWNGAVSASAGTPTPGPRPL